MSFSQYPQNPVTGQEYTVGNSKVVWDGQKFVSVPPIFNGNINSINSVEDLRAIAGAYNGQTVQLVSYYAGTNKGGGVLVWNSTSTAADDGGVTFAVTGVATGRWIRSLDGAVNVDMFGAIGDGVANDTTPILAACQAANQLGLQDVKFLAGTFNHTELNLTDLNVRLIGSGSLSTILKYIGANTSDGIKFGTSQNASRKVNGVGLQQIGVDANGLARRSVEVNSVYGGFFESVRILNPFEYGMYWTCANNRLVNASNEPADNQRCYINDLYVECIAAPAANAILLDGNAGTAAGLAANTSLNHFQNIRLNIRNGNGFIFGYADGNTLTSLFVFRPDVNTGYGLVFKEDASGQARHARHNLCYNIQTSRSTVLAEGGGTGNPSYDNTIFGYNLGNNGVDFPPVIQTGASLTFHTNNLSFKSGASQSVIVDGSTLTENQAYLPLVRSRVSGECLRVSNRGSNHLKLERPSSNRLSVESEWGIAVVGASGSAGENLRVSRVSGTGVVEIPSIATAVIKVTGSGTTVLNNQSSNCIVDVSSGGTRFINLPLAASFGANRTAVIRVFRADNSANTVTVQRQGSDTINGLMSENLSGASGKIYISDGVNTWYGI